MSSATEFANTMNSIDTDPAAWLEYTIAYFDNMQNAVNTIKEEFFAFKELTDLLETMDHSEMIPTPVVRESMHKSIDIIQDAAKFYIDEMTQFEPIDEIIQTNTAMVEHLKSTVSIFDEHDVKELDDLQWNLCKCRRLTTFHMLLHCIGQMFQTLLSVRIVNIELLEAKVAEMEENDGSFPECSICMCSIKKQYMKTKCDHEFHICCLATWVSENEHNATCPMCRQQL